MLPIQLDFLNYFEKSNPIFHFDSVLYISPI